MAALGLLGSILCAAALSLVISELMTNYSKHNLI